MSTEKGTGRGPSRLVVQGIIFVVVFAAAFLVTRYLLKN